MDLFVKTITIISVCLMITFILLGRFVAGYKVIDCVVFGIGILVANVPEGLQGAMTVGLAITAQKLSKKYVLVKDLEAVETLGSTSCICSDKTGTLTQNKMTVDSLWYNGKEHKAENREIFGKNHKYDYDENDHCFKLL